MTKTGLFLVLMLGSIHAWSADIRVTDENLQSCLEKIAAENGWVSAEQFTDIKCHNQNIKSLEGLNAFVGLEKLSLYKNEISHASLHGLTKLRHLNLARNQLESMELSALPALEGLYFFDNDIESLSLVDLPRLTQFKGNANDMTEFTYSGLPSVKKVYLFDNELKTIDINNLPSLEYMDVRENPMPDKLYEEMDAMEGVTILHDGNAEDW